MQNSPTIDDAIAWILIQRDNGTTVTLESASERFPDFTDEIRVFLSEEQRLVKIRDVVAQRHLPERFAHYELLETLGRGSFGEVRKAWDTRLLRMVALKVPRFASTDEDSSRRFLREGRTASQLAHPNVVGTYEIGEHDSTPYIASEFVEGKQLRDYWIASQSAPDAKSQKAAARIVAAIADGLAHAHERRVVHRDLNPKNVIVDESGTPRILDFGLAKFAEDIGTVTIHGEVVGTPAYVSPEQINGKGHEVDGRSDIYSAGVILYELLTGERPFDGELKLLLHRIRHENPESPAKLRPEISKTLSDICLKCLAKSPNERFANATELKSALDAFLAGDEPAVPLFAKKSHCSFNSTTVATLAGILCTLLVGFVVVSSSNRAKHVPPAEILESDVIGGGKGTVAMIAIAPTEDCFVAGDHRGVIKAWSWPEKEQLWENSDHTDYIWAVDYSPDGKYVATASWDHSAHVRDPMDGRLVHTLKGHTDRLCCVEFDPSGSTVLTGSCDDTIRIWNLASGKETDRITLESGGDFTDIAFTPSQDAIIAGGWDRCLTKWTWPSKNLVFRIRAHEKAVWHVDVSVDGRQILTASEDGTVAIWNAKKGDLIKRHQGGEQVTSALFHPDGQHIIYATHDKEVVVWDPSSDTIKSRYVGHAGEVYDIAIHNRDQKILSGSTDGSIRVWDLAPQPTEQP